MQQRVKSKDTVIKKQHNVQKNYRYNRRNVKSKKMSGEELGRFLSWKA